MAPTVSYYRDNHKDISDINSRAQLQCSLCKTFKYYQFLFVCLVVTSTMCCTHIKESMVPALKVSNLARQQIKDEGEG